MATERPVVMILSPHDIFPPTSGSERRIYEITRGIANLCSVYLVHPLEKGQTGSLGSMADLIKQRHPVVLSSRLGKFFSPRILMKILSMHRDTGFDCIFIHTFLPGLQGIILKHLTGVPFLLDEQNAEFFRVKRSGNRFWPLVKIWETIVCRGADRVFSVSDIDSELIESLGIPAAKILVSRNGYNQEVFRPDVGEVNRVRRELGIPEGPVVLYFGNFNYKPNSEALVLIEEEIVPRVVEELPDARFVIAGRNTPHTGWKGDNLFFPGEIREIQALINLSDLVICPLLSGGGTRLKILESVACGKRVVSTTLGAEGLDKDIPSTHLFVEDEMESFSRAIVSLVRTPFTPGLPEGLKERYSWKNIVELSIFPVIREVTE